MASMSSHRLDSRALAAHLHKHDASARKLALQLRALVLQTVPQAAESVKFGSLAYSRPGEPFGCIGGNICMIEVRGDRVRLSFIHGASLADPRGLLLGRAKAKRFVEIRSLSDLRRPGLRALIGEAGRFRPAKAHS